MIDEHGDVRSPTSNRGAGGSVPAGNRTERSSERRRSLRSNSAAASSLRAATSTRSARCCTTFTAAAVAATTSPVYSKPRRYRSDDPRTGWPSSILSSARDPPASKRWTASAMRQVAAALPAAIRSRPRGGARPHRRDGRRGGNGCSRVLCGDPAAAWIAMGAWCSRSGRAGPRPHVRPRLMPYFPVRAREIARRRLRPSADAVSGSRACRRDDYITADPRIDAGSVCAPSLAGLRLVSPSPIPLDPPATGAGTGRSALTFRAGSSWLRHTAGCLLRAVPPQEDRPRRVEAPDGRLLRARGLLHRVRPPAALDSAHHSDARFRGRRHPSRPRFAAIVASSTAGRRLT